MDLTVENHPISQCGSVNKTLDRRGPEGFSASASPTSSLFPRRALPADILAIWRLQQARNGQTSSISYNILSPEQQQSETGEEGASQGGQAKSQSRSSTRQSGGKHLGSEKKKRKSEKESKPIQAPPKKPPSATGRHGGAPQGPHSPGTAGSTSTETGSNGPEARPGSNGLLGPPSLETGDPEEAVRSMLGISLDGMAADATIALVLRTLAFCKDYLLSPEVTACLINFLGFQLQWLGDSASRTSCIEAEPSQPDGETDDIHEQGSCPRSPRNRLCSGSFSIGVRSGPRVSQLGCRCIETELSRLPVSAEFRHSQTVS